MYQAQISRSTPTAYVFLIDQSASMGDLMKSGTSKANFVADVLNKTLRELAIRCAGQDGFKDYFSIGAIGYGGHGVRSGLTDGWLQPISVIADNPRSVETRQKLVSDGAGGLVEKPVKFPVWFDAASYGGTPMRAGIREVRNVLEGWCDDNPTSYPPTVLHVTDGQSTDGDPEDAARELRSIGTRDGQVLLYNLHISSSAASPVRFPSSEAALPDSYSRMLFRMSSVFPTHIVDYARDAFDIRLEANSRAMVFNADVEEIVKFLDIGTRPASGALDIPHTSVDPLR